MRTRKEGKQAKEAASPVLAPLMCPVDALELPTYVKNALRRNRINTLGTLMERFEEGNLVSCFRIGKKAISAVGGLLQKLEEGKVELPEEDSWKIPRALRLPRDILSRPLRDLRIPPKITRALQGMKVMTVGEALKLGPRSGFAKKYPLDHERLREELRKLEKARGGYFSDSAFDIDLIERLHQQYDFRMSWLARWLGISRQRISSGMQKSFNRGRWLGSPLQEEDRRVFLEMTKDRKYFFQVDGRKYVILNNKKDDAVLMVIQGSWVKCWFLADIPKALAGAIREADMHRLSREENGPEPLGQTVWILRKPHFRPDDSKRFRRIAESRQMSPEEYSQWRFGMPCCGQWENLVTDERIVRCFEENLREDGRVRIPSTAENRWIRTYCSRQGFSLRSLIEFYGYKGRQFPAAI